MATAMGGDKREAGGLDPYRIWKDAFSESDRQRMMHDDLTAGASVAMLLTGVIFVGVVLILVGVTLSVLF